MANLEEPLSLATAQNLDEDTIVPIAGGTLNVNENARTGLFSTCGATAYTVRKDIGDYTMSSDSSKGDLVFFIDLNPKGFTDAVVDQLVKNFIYFQIGSISLTFKCIAPWSTASGSMQYFYNPDPENRLSDDPDIAIQQAMRLAQSKQLSSKGEAATVCNIPPELASQVFKTWRYCKQAATPNPRTESYGQLGGIVRGVPSLGDGTSWTVTMVATLMFHDMSFNSPSTTVSLVYDEKVDSSSPSVSEDGSGYLYIKTEGVSSGVVSSGSFMPTDIDKEFVTIVDSTEDPEIVERYFYSNAACFYADDGTTMTVWLKTNFSPTGTAINDIESATITTTLKRLTGLLVYTEAALVNYTSGTRIAKKQTSNSFLRALQRQTVVRKNLLLSKYRSIIANK